MASKPWHGPKWPQGVPYEISGYEKPLFSVLDDAASDFPDNVYTIFNDGSRTFAQVKDTADRVANFLAARGIKKGDRVAYFCRICLIIRPSIAVFSKPVLFV